MLRRSAPPPRDPWRNAPVGELEDPLLPRWFVLSILALIPVAVIVLVAASTLGGRDPQPVAERRPPPSDGRTTAVGDVEVGTTPPVPFDASCPWLRGVRIAGAEQDLRTLRSGLASLCNFPPDAATRDRLQRFAAAGGVVRFAAFRFIWVDSTAELGADPPRILLNVRFTRVGQPRWIAPLVAHDVTFLDEDPATARGALAARRVEREVCEQVLTEGRASRGCQDAAALLALPDPVAALRAVGFR